MKRPGGKFHPAFSLLRQYSFLPGEALPGAGFPPALRPDGFRMPILRFVATLIILLFSPLVVNAFAGSADAITGLWAVDGGEGHIAIYRCGPHYCGSIAWLKNPVYPPEDKGMMAGKPLVDRENPQAKLKGRPLIGLQIMSGYTFRGDNLWDEGRIYNTENGKTYRSRISLQNRDLLELRGYIGIPLLGGSTEWKRLK